MMMCYTMTMMIKQLVLVVMTMMIIISQFSGDQIATSSSVGGDQLARMSLKMIMCYTMTMMIKQLVLVVMTMMITVSQLVLVVIRQLHYDYDD